MFDAKQALIRFHLSFRIVLCSQRNSKQLKATTKIICLQSRTTAQHSPHSGARGICVKADFHSVEKVARSIFLRSLSFQMQAIKRNG